MWWCIYDYACCYIKEVEIYKLPNFELAFSKKNWTYAWRLFLLNHVLVEERVNFGVGSVILSPVETVELKSLSKIN
jgi:hypothetical protein